MKKLIGLVDWKANLITACIMAVIGFVSTILIGINTDLKESVKK